MNTFLITVAHCALFHICAVHGMDERIQSSSKTSIAPWHREYDATNLYAVGAYNVHTVRHVQLLLDTHKQAGNIANKSPLSNALLDRLNLAIAYKEKILPESMAFEDCKFHQSPNSSEHRAFHGKIVASLILCSQLYYDTYERSANFLSNEALERVRICAGLIQEEDDAFFKQHCIGDIGLQSFAILLTIACKEAHHLLAKNKCST